MTTNLINKVLASLSLLAMTSMFAIPGVDCDPCGSCCGDPIEPIVCCEPPAPGPFAFLYPKDVGLACPNDIYVFGDFLYFTADQGGLELGISYSPCTKHGVDQPLEYPVLGGAVQGFCDCHTDWEWNAGFRLGVGLYMDHDAWTLEAVYTHVNVTNSQTVSLAGNSILIPFWMVGNPGLTLGEPRGSGRWSANFNTFDVHLGKPFHVSRYLILSPHFGVRFASIDQNFTAQYSACWNGLDGAEMVSCTDHWSIGSRFGMDTEWLLGCGAGFYANFALSLLYGKFDVDQTWRGGSFADNEMNNSLDYDCYETNPNFEIELGLFWGMFFCNNRYHAMVKIGWEFHDWLNQNHLRRWYDDTNPMYNDVVSRGDFTMNGFALRVQLDF